MFNFPYTKIYYEQLKRDFHKLNVLLSFISIFITLVYPILAIFIQIGNFYVNVTIVGLTLIYGITCLIVGSKNKAKATLSRIYNYVRIVVGAVSLAINIYSIYIAATNVNGVAIILSTLMIIFWILKVFISIAYDILIPRLTTLLLCVKEDTKPTAKLLDFFTKAPLFEYWKEDIPEEVVKAMKEARKYEELETPKNIKNDIDDRYEQLLKESDINNDGIIDLQELVEKAICIDGAIVDQKEFLFKEFTGELTRKNIEKYISDGPNKAGVSLPNIEAHCELLANENLKDIAKIKKYLKDNIINIKKTKDYKRLLALFIPTLKTMQKIIYLYGFKQLDIDQSKNKILVQALIISMPIAFDEADKILARDALIKLRKAYSARYVKNIFGKLINKIDDDGFVKMIKKSIPIINVIAKNYAPIQIANVIKAVDESDEIVEAEVVEK